MKHMNEGPQSHYTGMLSSSRFGLCAPWATCVSIPSSHSSTAFQLSVLIRRRPTKSANHHLPKLGLRNPISQHSDPQSVDHAIQSLAVQSLASNHSSRLLTGCTDQPAAPADLA